MSFVALYGNSDGEAKIRLPAVKLTSIHYKNKKVYYLFRAFIQVETDSSDINSVTMHFNCEIKNPRDLGILLTNYQLMTNLAEHGFKMQGNDIYEFDSYIFGVPSYEIELKYGDTRRNVTSELILSFNINIYLKMTVEKCPHCKGTGIDPLKSSAFLKKECTECGGKGHT